MTVTPARREVTVPVDPDPEPADAAPAPAAGRLPGIPPEAARVLGDLGIGRLAPDSWTAGSRITVRGDKEGDWPVWVAI